LVLVTILQVACKKEARDLQGIPISDSDTLPVEVIPPEPVVYCSASNQAPVNATLEKIGQLSGGSIAMAVEVSGKIVFSKSASMIEMYDINSKSWSAIPTHGAYIDRDAITVANENKLFFAGGGYFWFPDEYNSVVSIYDVSTNTWSETNLSKPRMGLAAVTVGNKVLFSGGYEATNDYDIRVSKVIDVYDVSTNEWSVDSLQEGRAFHDAVEVNGKVYFAGGENSYQGRVNTVEVYDVVTHDRNYTSFTGLTGRVSGNSSNGEIFWAGNSCITAAMNADDLSMENLYGIQANNGSKVVVKDGKVLVLKYGLNVFDIYDPQQKTWHVGKLPVPIRLSAAIISVNNVVYIAGGLISCSPIPNGCIPVYSGEVFRLEL